MKNQIVDELNKKYGISKYIINLMIKDTMSKGYSLEEAFEIISKFLEKNK